MRKIVKIGKDLIEKQENFVIAKVVDTQGSTPRKKGAWLLMREKWCSVWNCRWWKVRGRS